MVESDFRAWQKVLPNFPFGNQWYSKERYGIVLHQGKHKPWPMPDTDPDEPTFDQVDWVELLPKYRYWKKRLWQQGLTSRQFQEDLRDYGRSDLMLG